MDINMLLMAYGKYFPAVRMPEIKQALEQIGPDNASQILASGFKDPMTALVLGLFLGGLGVDRFYIGDNSIGALKLVVFIIGWVITLITCGILFFIPYIWNIIDLFYIMDATKEKNYQQLMTNLMYYNYSS